MAKGKYVSTRISEYQYDKLKKEAELYGFANFSDYIREKLSAPYIVDNPQEEKQPSQIDRNLKMAVEREIIRLYYCIGQLPKNLGQRREMEQEACNIWQLLN